MLFLFFFFKQKTAYEMRISDWSSDVCSSDLAAQFARDEGGEGRLAGGAVAVAEHEVGAGHGAVLAGGVAAGRHGVAVHVPDLAEAAVRLVQRRRHRPVIRLPAALDAAAHLVDAEQADRKRVVQGQSVSVRVDLGCGGISNTKK